MKTADKKYILENRDKKTIQQISQELNLKERKVRKFLEETSSRKEIKFSLELPSNKKSSVIASIILIICLGLLVYANSISGQFIWDDQGLIVENVYIKNYSHIPKIFREDIAAGVGEKYNFYRPVQLLTYMIDYSLWGLKVSGYHLTSILLHISVALVLFWLVILLYKDWLLSLLASLLFLVHPLHTEAVAYISGRADSLSALFMLLCFVYYIKYEYRKSIFSFLVVVVTYTLSILSRESSLIFPLGVLLYHYTFKRPIKLVPILSLLNITFLYIMLRLTVLRLILYNVTLSSNSVLQRLPGFFVALAKYVKLFLFPFNLHMEYGNKLFSFIDIKSILGLIIFAVLLIYLIKNKNNKLGFFSVSWFFIMLLPAANLYPLNAYMAEHWLYLPSIGFFLILAKGLQRFFYNRKGFQIPAGLITLSLLVYFSILTIKQSSYWKEPVSFFKKTLEYNPDSSRLYYNLGNVYSSLNRKEDAITAYNKSIELFSGYAKAYYNLANAYKSVNKIEKAVDAYKKAIEIDSQYAEAYNNLGNIYSSLNEHEEAINMYKRAIETDPALAQAYSNLGNMYIAANKYEEAVILFKKATEVNPNLVEAYNNLGNVYLAVNRKEEAINEYKKAIEIKPDYIEAYNNLGVVYNAVNKNKEAEAVLKKAIQLNPEFASAYGNLSMIYFNNKQHDLAVEYCDKAQDLGAVLSAVFLQALEPYRKK